MLVDGNKITKTLEEKLATELLFMTPVPGGVGPITIVSLLRNLL
ncbi:MAG TPA: hypothetical protein DCS23_00835 [Candidatus Yonathbacteria bacterium]|nr:hypothetical protein [Candidatus Yonathbacteria bacterium]